MKTNYELRGNVKNCDCYSGTQSNGGNKRVVEGLRMKNDDGSVRSENILVLTKKERSTSTER